MTQHCNGCKALIAATNDDYDVYSLQRQLFPVDPLVIIPQPGSYVTLVCEDGFIVKVLYKQGEDWPTVWNTIKAECENHKKTVPVVETGTGTDPDEVIPPIAPPTPNPNPDPMPGPNTVVPPPPVAPPVTPPTPTPPSNAPYGWPWTPPSGEPFADPTNPHNQPDFSMPSTCHWGYSTYITASYQRTLPIYKDQAWEHIYIDFFTYKETHPWAYISYYLENDLLEPGVTYIYAYLNEPLSNDPSLGVFCPP
jgi:hypothetical protein